MKTRRRSYALTAAAVVMAWTVLFPGPPARAQLSVYDDFNDPSHLIRGDKWAAFGSIVGSQPLEGLHIIDSLLFPRADPKLVFVDRIHIVPGTFGLWFFGYGATIGPINFSAIQADVALHFCTPTAGVETSARINLNGVHDATPPNGSLGDIFGVAGVRCPTTGGAPELFWQIQRCNTALCSSTSVLTVGVLGPAVLGQEYVLRIEKVGTQFRFTADGFPPQLVPAPGAVSPTANGPFFNPVTVVVATTQEAGGDFVLVATFDDFMIAP
jgi:hypothetical protein